MIPQEIIGGTHPGCQTCTSDHRAGSWPHGLCRGSWLGSADSWPPVGVDACPDKRRGGPKEKGSTFTHYLTRQRHQGAVRAEDCNGFPDHLQHLVRAWLNAWGHVAGVMGHLLHLCKVVDWVPVEDHFTHWDQRVFFMRPNLKDKTCKHPLGNFKPSRLR